MPGTYVHKTWESNDRLLAPAQYRRACGYDSFIPEPLGSLPVNIDAWVTGVLSEAEASIRHLNEQGGAALAPLARLLLRTESIASSKIEGMQLGVRDLARAEAKVESGGKVSDTAAEVLANIASMELAMNEAVQAPTVGRRDRCDSHTAYGRCS
jgi:Fic family protein